MFIDCNTVSFPKIFPIFFTLDVFTTYFFFSSKQNVQHPRKQTYLYSLLRNKFPARGRTTLGKHFTSSYCARQSFTTRHDRLWPVPFPFSERGRTIKCISYPSHTVNCCQPCFSPYLFPQRWKISYEPVLQSCCRS